MDCKPSFTEDDDQEEDPLEDLEFGDEDEEFGEEFDEDIDLEEDFGR